MPSTIGIVASGEDVLNDAVFWVDAGLSSVVSGALSNLGTGGSALNAQFGSTSGTDSFDPQLLTHTGTNYLFLPGLANNAASAPNLAAYTPASSLQIDWDFTPQTFTPAEQSLVTHFGVAGNRGWRLSLGTSAFALVWSTDGGDVNVGSQSVSFTTMGATVGSRHRGRVILRFNNGSGNYDVRWYTVDAVGTATLVETDTGVGTTSIFASTQALEIGSRTGLGVALNANIFSTKVTVDGTAVFDANFTTGITTGAQTTFTESSANAATVTINRATSGRKSVAVVRNVLSFGTDDYLEVADNDLLDFAASDSFTVLAVVRQWNNAGTGNRSMVAKSVSAASSAGYYLYTGSNARTPGFGLRDSTTLIQRSSGATPTDGSMFVAVGLVNRSTGLSVYTNNSTIGPTSIASVTGTSANALPLRVGAYSDNTYSDMELVAAAVWRRALNTNEIATLTARYT